MQGSPPSHKPQNDSDIFMLPKEIYLSGNLSPKEKESSDPAPTTSTRMMMEPRLEEPQLINYKEIQWVGFGPQATQFGNWLL